MLFFPIASPVFKAFFLIALVDQHCAPSTDDGCDNTCDTIEGTAAVYRTDAKAQHDKANHYKKRCTKE